MPRKKGVPPKRDIRKQKLPPSRFPVYRPEFPDMLIAHMKAGHSFPTFAAEIGTHWDTLYDWCDPSSARYQSAFSEAKKIGDALLLKFDESIGTAGITGRLERVTKREVLETPDGQKIIKTEMAAASFAQGAWIFRMKNRNPEFYKDRQDVALMDAEGKPLQQNQVIVNIPSNGREGLVVPPAQDPEDEE